MKSGKTDLAKSTIHGTLWTYLARYSGKLLNFISITILARLLIQEDFGVAGYALVVIGFLELPGLGVGPALIYYDKDSRRTNTGFWLALLIGLLLLGVAWVIAAPIGDFFNDHRSIPVTRALALSFPVIALGVVPNAFLEKELSFKRKFVPDVIGSIAKGAVSIVLAWLNYGAWSLIIGQLTGTLATTIMLWVVLPRRWLPSLEFDVSLARSLLSYGGSIISVYMLGMLLLNVDYLLIGRYLGAAALGVYTVAFRIPELLIKQFYATVSSVLFPVYAKMRDQPDALRKGFLTTMRYVTMMTVPLALGLALVSRPLVLTIFGEKWIEAAPVMALIAIYALILSLLFSAGSVFKAQGRPEILSRLHFLNLVVLAPALWWATTEYRTITAVAWAQVIVVTVVGIFRMVITARILKTSLIAIAQTLYPSIICGAVMALTVMGVLELLEGAPPVVQLIAAVPVGVFTYCGMVWWVQADVVRKASRTLRTSLIRG